MAGLRASRFVVAALVAVVFVLSAPYIGQIRSAIRSSYPRQFVTIVGTIVGVLVAGALVSALLRIKSRRVMRYGLIALSLVLAVSYSSWHATGRPEVDVVELFHFVEYGLITLLFYLAWRPLDDAAVLVLPVLAGFIVGTLDEWLQWFIPARVGEMNDVFLNLAAIAAGLLFSVGVDPPARLAAGFGPGSRARVGRLLGVAVLVFAVFFHVVHLGHRIDDPNIGSFVSRYSGDTLLQLAAAKREEWRRVPFPTTLKRVSREDQYMSEGVVHVQERNEQWSAGHHRAAWLENRLLETYFEPVLDTPSYVSKTGHRWPPEQRLDAGVRSAADGASPAPYVSDAFPYRLYLWRPGVYWSIVVAVLVGLMLLVRERRGAASTGVAAGARTP